MGFAYLRKGQYVATPLPVWPKGLSVVDSLPDFKATIRRHSPLCAFASPEDSAYVEVPVEMLKLAIKHTLITLGKQGVRYVNNSWDCENFVNEVDQTLRKMAALAGIKASPLTCCLSVKLKYKWARTPAVGWHAIGCANTDAGPYVFEAQNGIMCPIEVYPNRALIREATNL